MSTLKDIYTLRVLGACDPAIEWAKTQPSAEVAWQNCQRGDWLIWLAVRVLTEPEERKIALLTVVEIAETAQRPGLDHEARACTETVRAYLRGEATIAQVRRAAFAAAAADAANAADDARRADAANAAFVYAARCAANAANAADAANAANAADAAAANASFAADAYADAYAQLADIVRARIPFEMVARAATKVTT